MTKTIVLTNRESLSIGTVPPVTLTAYGKSGRVQPVENLSQLEALAGAEQLLAWLASRPCAAPFTRV